MPWMSETTAMMDVTATMFPSTVRNDRSLFAQMALSARTTASRNSCMTSARPGRSLGWRARRTPDRHFHFDRRSIGQLTHRREWTDDHFVAFLETGEDLEILLAGDSGLDGHEHGFAVP